MTQKSRKLSVGSSIVDELSPLLTRRGNKKKCSRSQSLNLGNVKQQQGRWLNQSFRMSNRDQTTAGDYLSRSDELAITHCYIKYNKTFHKLFQEIPEEERLTHTFTCSLQREVLYHGKLFVSENNVCFYSSVLLKETKVVIAISSVKEIKKHNPTLSVLSVLTSSGEKYLFASVRNYSVCCKLLQSLCCQPQESSPSSSPYLSSAEFEHDAVSLRLKRLLGSKNPEAKENDSQHPHIPCLQASSLSSLEDSFENVVLSDSISPIDGGADGTCKSAQGGGFTNETDRAGSWIWRFLEKVTLLLFFREVLSLRVVFHIFLVLMLLLLLVSGYIGLRITALEEQLSSLGALADLSSHYAEYQET
ncbi:GRAM domain-containing protein 2A-like isoform X2 [Xiphophorus maculatus]|uniref:GRAM domain-containing protein 2A-like isoform X2 n=1 Tax=Xiphophorus maculatus TaxID=8083 RepID=UPI000C6DC3A6|nr:GRAM domain-containing protein 2A-like isoform X2 [Xiphophorus maculatus]